LNLLGLTNQLDQALETSEPNMPKEQLTRTYEIDFEALNTGVEHYRA